VATAASTCGTNGLCNGAGQCALFPNGTQCAAPGCQGNSNLVTSACNGSGQCVKTTVDCTPYKCNGTSFLCYPTCTNQGSCSPGHTCTGSNGNPGVCQ
jgi:hypothetical protein